MSTMTLFFRRIALIDWMLLIVVSVISIAYWQEVPAVPFHPDEATYLYMAADWDQLNRQPLGLAYQPGPLDAALRYRLIDPPLQNYLIGIARSAAGFSALSTDWNWSLTWGENDRAGALPSPAHLAAARMGPAVLFPFSLLLLYAAAMRLGGRFTGWSALLLLAGNALVLLHTRRAMAEGGLLFTVCLWMACLVACRKRPWLIGLAAGFMICAKQSTLPLVLVGLAAIVLYAQKPIRWQGLLQSILLYSILFLGVIVLLNPVFWSHPWQALQTGWMERLQLATRQTEEFQSALPETVITSPSRAALSIVANLWLTPPAVADVGNYLAETQQTSQAYLASPFHQLGRGLLWGAISLTLSLIGLFFAVKRSFAPADPQRHSLILLSGATLLQFAALVIVLPLPFQRYVMPLVPFTCLWAAYSLGVIQQKAAANKTKDR